MIDIELFISLIKTYLNKEYKMNSITFGNLVSNQWFVLGTMAAISSAAAAYCWKNKNISGPRSTDDVTIQLTKDVVEKLKLNEEQTKTLTELKKPLLADLHRERKFAWGLVGGVLGATITGIALFVLNLSIYLAKAAADAREAR